MGYNQLDYRLRNDPRVISHERTNIMTLRSGVLDPPADAAVADLSFRSLEGAAAHIVSLTAEGWLIALAKPQFELRGRPSAFSGVLHDRGEIARVLLDLADRLVAEGLGIRGVLASPIRGRKGNQEFLFWLVRRAESGGDYGGIIRAAVTAAADG